jgi:hypothetical protein
MATIKDYYNTIISIKDGEVNLDELQPFNDNGAQLISDLNSKSKVAVWRLWCWVMAALAWMLHMSIEEHKNEVNELVAKNAFGGRRFYQQASFDFQLGHELVWNGVKYHYAAQDPASKIIKRCSVDKSQGILIFKVTKEAGGLLEPLTDPEKTAFNHYLNDIVYAGTTFQIISEESDELKMSIKIYVDPQQISLTGEIIGTATKPVEEAIENYISNLPFDGKMNVQKMQDAIQAVPGVKDLLLNSISSKYGDLPWNSFEREVKPYAGYMELNIASSEIEYIQYV